MPCASITPWLNKDRQGGLPELLTLRTAPGAPAKIQGQALEKLQQRLQSPEGFESYKAIVEWLDQECGLKLKYDTVDRFVAQKLKAKLKAPRPVSPQQAPGAIASFWETSGLP